GVFEAPARYGGVLDLEATVRGSRRRPIVEGQITVTEGRVRRVTYEKLAGRIMYADSEFDPDLRPDQAPGVWVEARGKLPMALHLEDGNGDPLDVRGSLATHELSVADLEIDMTARKFELLRNDYGRIDVDAMLNLRGRYEAPRLVGDLTISDGTLNVDRILEE